MVTHAIEYHTTKAGEFERRYRAFAEDPYRSIFTYGRKKIEELLDREIARFSSGARALDAGCGTGFNVARLLGRGFDVTGVEPSVGMRERAVRDNPRARIVDGDVCALPFGEAAFDIAVCIEVIRYLDDPVRALVELHRVLAPGGMAFVTAAPALSLDGYAVINQVTGRVKVPTFAKVRQTFMTVGSAQRAMREAGFVDVAIHGAFLGPWNAVARLSPRALPHVLRTFEPLDDRLSDFGPLRNFGNHLVLIGSK